MPKIRRLSAAKGKPKQRKGRIVFRPNNPQIFRSIEAALEAYPQTKKSDWLIADTKIEYERFNFLLKMQALGHIDKLHFHPSFELLPSIKLPKNALRPAIETQRALSYTADFSYFWRGIFMIEDTKASYSNSEKNREHKRAGKAIVEPDARLRHKLLIAKMLEIHEADFVFRIVTDALQPIHQL